MADSGKSPRRHSRARLTALLAIAVGMSVGAIVSESWQGASYVWEVDGELLRCRTIMAPFASSSRTVRHRRIEGFEVSPSRDEPREVMLRIRFDMVDLDLPMQNSRVIADLESYATDLDGLLRAHREGDQHPVLRLYHPGFWVTWALIVLAFLAWLVFFAAGLPRTGTIVPRRLSST